MRIIFLLFLVSCASEQYQISEYVILKPKQKGKNHFVFWGLGQKTAIATKSACDPKEDVVAVDNYQTVFDTIFTYISGGIYSPRSYAIFCYEKPNENIKNVSKNTVAQSK